MNMSASLLGIDGTLKSFAKYDIRVPERATQIYTTKDICKVLCFKTIPVCLYHKVKKLLVIICSTITVFQDIS